MNKHISKSLAQSIHEKAKEKGVELPESENVWIGEGEKAECENIAYFEMVEGEWGCCRTIVFKETDEVSEILGIPAYDTAELGEILPADTKYEGYQVRTHDHLEFANSEPEARGKMLLYLIENDLL